MAKKSLDPKTRVIGRHTAGWSNAPMATRRDHPAYGQNNAVLFFFIEPP